MRSALFIDFDNVFTGLRRLSPGYAEAFARQPSRWLEWLVATLQPAVGMPEAPSQRRVLVRRCYLNPVMYQGYRIGFSRAGFEIVDCPPMTSAGKTSTDIHMVLDIVDVLQAKTHYDEFIVFSADADFTPVLRKLRREDRRTTMFAAGATSASYDACADLIIDPEAFIHEALGFDEEELVPAPPVPSEDSMLVQAEALVWAMVDDADQPVPLPALTKALATRIPALPATDWAGKGTFIALLRSLPLDPLRIDRELNAILDPRRLQNAPSPSITANAGTAAGRDRTDPRPAQASLEQVTQWLGEEVAASDRPVPIARLAQIARARFPGIEGSWLGHGSWKKLLESLNLAGIRIEWHQLAGWALDPDRHVLQMSAAPTLSEGGVSPARESSVLRLLDAVDLPLLDPGRYRAQLEALAQALDIQPYSLSQVTKSMRDHCQQLGFPVSREQCLRLLRTLVFNGFDPETSAHGFDDLVATTCGVIVAACQREGVPIDDADRRALLGWMTGQAGPASAAL
ncbi:NYN domain-containing protein [Ideonella oryzae]|uniref:NYN domain-containing protein n=1 Tax=Ideonella oryzae TaxID=2937441 RepID=A0ABT1BRJ4_9BURK|nr:NYN domain-containing protein [Ideonella oryzae]MCO5978544.1 NYN domain-containing protein [Ideonella oryzae]